MSTQGNRPGSLRINDTGMPGGTAVELDGQNIASVLQGVTVRVAVGEMPNNPERLLAAVAYLTDRKGATPDAVH